MSIKFRHGVGGAEQESSFMNATLQRAGDLDYSIAVYIELPPGLTERQVEERIRGALSLAASRPNVSIEVEIGPADE